MISNSAIFTNTVYGVSSGDISANLAAKAKTTKEEYLGSYSGSNLRTIMPKVPSNQRVAKDK